MADKISTNERVDRDADALRELIVASSSAAHVVTNSHGMILYANRRAADIFATPVDDLAGRSLLELFPVDRRDEIISHIAAMIHAPNSLDVGLPRDHEPVQWATRGLLPNGLTLPVLITADCLMHEGEPACVLCLNRFEEHESTVDELQSASEQLRQFAYLASHDLRSPLAKIATLVRWIREDADEAGLDESTRENMQRLSTQVNRMEKLMNGLLDYARAGGSRERAFETPLSQLMSDVVELAQVPSDFRVTWPHDLPTIQCQSTPLQHTLLNLINNAVEHHDRAAGHIHIDCEFVEPGRVSFSVEDDGPGIPERQRERVFNIFHTLGESKNGKDRGGIGLAIVKRMVLRAGGEIHALPAREGRGTRMEFTWPSFSI